jgi:hypothetical protein
MQYLFEQLVRREEDYPFVSSKESRKESRRFFMRARAEAREKPAKPTTVKTMVGFSGESSQVPLSISPPWAWSGRAAERKIVKPSSRNSFFMVSSFGKVTVTENQSQRTFSAAL